MEVICTWEENLENVDNFLIITYNEIKNRFEIYGATRNKP